MIEKELQTDLSVIFAKIPQIALAYLFGSRVEGTVGPKSDYDFGFLCDPIDDKTRIRTQLSIELARQLDTKDIDLVILNDTPIEMAFSIVANGLLIYEKNTAARVEYEARVVGLYFDYLPFLKSQRLDILRGEEYGARIQRYREALRRTERTLEQIRPT